MSAYTVGTSAESTCSASTLAALRRMSTERQRMILRFLEGAGLIDREAPVIDLGGIDSAGDTGAAAGAGT
ncbi:MAG TPA: hypothetical protein VGS80_24340 [Ktedonobacterales bacterium]|nr:hypothetical protein [Ktedonobacterales bacterium]